MLSDSRGVTRPKFMEQFFKDVEDMQADLANIAYAPGAHSPQLPLLGLAN